LQLTQYAKLDDLPEAERQQLENEKPAPPQSPSAP
jgi:hypothetical protein